jgi:anthranilate phosphoribosyltransferase
MAAFMTAIVKTALTAWRKKEDLPEGQARELFDGIMSGSLSQATMGALLGALIVKGECVEELVGAALAMREKMVRVRCQADCIDTCGTGGDGVSTFNVSTAAAIVAAGAGATVAKHGNRTTTRVSGSTEVLDALGIDTEADVSVVERCLREPRVGYLNARLLHPAMKHAAPVRAAIPVRTIFNLLGPLTNPAGARRQLLGVPSPDLLDKIAEVLRRLGAAHAWVVHGADGLCDLSITGPSAVVEVRDGSLRRLTVVPEQVGLRHATLDGLLVRSPAESADKILSILRGEKGSARDHTLLNSGAALVVAGRASGLAEGIALAAKAIDDGDALQALQSWREIARPG